MMRGRQEAYVLVDQRCELSGDASVVNRVAIPGRCHHESLLSLVRHEIRTQIFRVCIHTAYQLSATGTHQLCAGTPTRTRSSAASG